MTIKNFGYPLSINEIFNEFGNGKNIKAYNGQLWAKPSNGTSGNFASTGQPLSFTDFYGKAKRKIINLTISADTQNYVLDSSVAGYIAGISDITLTINNGIKVGSASTSNPAFWIKNLTTGDTVSIVNNGYIVGAGGDGGNWKSNGSNGGNALQVSYTTTITNNGTIAGGGGGGAGGGDEEAFGGGGGAGYIAGSAGQNGDYGAANGTLLTGGKGADSPDGDHHGGSGGDLGQPGTANYGSSYTVYSPGAAGYYLVGLSNVTFAVTGTRLGQVS